MVSCGSGPGHLLVAFCFSIAGYATYSVFANARPWSVLLWLAGAILVHDFVLLPLYTGAFWFASRAGRVRDDRRRQAILDHLVAPAVSGLLFLGMDAADPAPVGGQLSPTTGLAQDPYLVALEPCSRSGSSRLRRWPTRSGGCGGERSRSNGRRARDEPEPDERRAYSASSETAGDDRRG